ncbi:MAG: 3-phosphoshikimate 1-carboxyvinyltransferase [Anaerolineae bacterium]|nr:3-phosphoshikimate 1-carboxyvinyltransferase [Anaerolineae bacterium]
MNGASTTIRVRPGAALRGAVRVPGDKSLSHRALILGALAEGASHARGWLPAGDTLATLGCVRALGIAVEQEDATTLTVHGRGLGGLRAPTAPLDCGHAGTAMRLLVGVLAGQPFASTLDGSAQLRRRPMRRITGPLRQMGAQIADTDGRAPLHFRPAALRGMAHTLPVASAQVKSGLLLAGLFADGPTTVTEPGPARDHTERMLRAMGAGVTTDGFSATLTPGPALRPLDLTVPGDLSSAAFVLAAALLVGGGEVRVNSVGVNPTRTGLLDILAAMGGPVTGERERLEGGEPVADLLVRRADLRGTEVGGDLIVRAIDEFPALMVLATQAAGETVVRDAAELRVKETDRIAVMAGELRKLGAQIDERPDGFRIVGPQRLRGAVVQGHDDHRVAMALTVAGLVADGETVIEDAACAHDSFPGFVETMQALGAEMDWCDHD